MVVDFGHLVPLLEMTMVMQIQYPHTAIAAILTREMAVRFRCAGLIEEGHNSSLGWYREHRQDIARFTKRHNAYKNVLPFWNSISPPTSGRMSRSAKTRCFPAKCGRPSERSSMCSRNHRLERQLTGVIPNWLSALLRIVKNKG